MIFRRIPAQYRRTLREACSLTFLLAMITAPMVAQGTAMSEPDDTKPVQITGCMTARTRSGGFVLSGVFGRPVTVVGPNFLQAGLGHEVTLTGTWQANGVAPKNEKVEQTAFFVATTVKVTARQCASPPNPPASSSTSSGKHPGS